MKQNYTLLSEFICCSSKSLAEMALVCKKNGFDTLNNSALYFSFYANL